MESRLSSEDLSLVQDSNLPSLLLHLPNELLMQISAAILMQKSDEAIKTLNSLSQSCKSMYGLFQPSLDKLGPVELGSLIANGKIDVKKFESMLDHCPKLLLHEVEVTDRIGRRLRGTPLQIALMIGNVLLAHLMIPFFSKLPNGVEVLKQQTQNAATGSQSFDFKALINVFHLDPMTGNKPSETTLQSIEEFKKAVGLQGNQVLTFDNCYLDFSLFLNALISYLKKTENRNFRQENKKRILYCIHVLGYLQYLFSAFHIQLLFHGINKSIKAIHSKTSYEEILQISPEKDNLFSSEELGNSNFVNPEFGPINKFLGFDVTLFADWKIHGVVENGSISRNKSSYEFFEDLEKLNNEINQERDNLIKYSEKLLAEKIKRKY